VQGKRPVAEPYIYNDPQLYAENRFVTALEDVLRARPDAIPIAVGTGTINDLTKLAAHRTGRRYIAVGTAAAMDGYTAYGASITYQGSKQTFPCPAPIAVVADLDIMSAALPDLNAAGYADLMAETVAGADWLLAEAVGADQFTGVHCGGDRGRRVAQPGPGGAGHFIAATDPNGGTGLPGRP
jgi:glycerol-1-phosphate dehydrogenase [NAD(P)+]